MCKVRIQNFRVSTFICALVFRPPSVSPLMRRLARAFEFIELKTFLASRFSNNLLLLTPFKFPTEICVCVQVSSCSKFNGI